jgi:SOS-response transcriptional repressor LexA
MEILQGRRAIGNVEILDFDIASMPIMCSVPCGTPQESFEDIPQEDRETVGDYISQHPNMTYVFRVIGDSMIGAGLEHGDLVFVDSQLEAKDGDIVLADIDGEMTVKTYRLKAKFWSQEPILMPENPRYEPIHFADYNTVSIKGVVIGRYHRFPRSK